MLIFFFPIRHADSRCIWLGVNILRITVSCRHQSWNKLFWYSILQELSKKDKQKTGIPQAPPLSFNCTLWKEVHDKLLKLEDPEMTEIFYIKLKASIFRSVFLSYVSFEERHLLCVEIYCAPFSEKFLFSLEILIPSGFFNSSQSTHSCLSLTINLCKVWIGYNWAKYYFSCSFSHSFEFKAKYYLSHQYMPK